MHASTQLTVHNKAGVRLMEKLGFCRVVLARELTLEEIKDICSHTEMDVECFVHGALCMCMSGACYLSSMLGGRSGNRGLCAQPCRLNFRFRDKEYALSLKDMSYVNHLSELQKAGVSSFKIEGRMKRPEYVAAAVTACRQALEGQAPDLELLRSVFSRSGFTDGYLTGKRGPNMFGYRRKEDVLAGEQFFSSLRSLYKTERSCVPVEMRLQLCAGKPSSLWVSDGISTVLVTGPEAQAAIMRPLDRETAWKYLCKTGGTPFLLRDLAVLQEQKSVPSMLPASALNAMRRQALEKLLSAREASKPHVFSGKVEQFFPMQERKVPSLRIRLEKLEQMGNFPAAEKIILPVDELLRSDEAFLKKWMGKLVCELPPIFFPKEENIWEEKLRKVISRGIKEAYAENPGAFFLAQKEGMEVHGGTGLNILNSGALSEYIRLGAADLVLSYEINAESIKFLCGGCKRGVIGYGYLPLMRTRACPAGGPQHCDSCDGRPVLYDRKNVAFPMVCGQKKFVTLLNSVPLYIGDKSISGIEFEVLYFTLETAKQCEKIYQMFLQKEKPDFERTSGLYFRELL
jgi:putative protease